MNHAKLRRSWDVSELQRSKIEKRFRICDLAVLITAFCVGSHVEVLARQTAHPIAKLLIGGRQRRAEQPHISSGSPSTAHLVRRDSKL